MIAEIGGVDGIRSVGSLGDLVVIIVVVVVVVVAVEVAGIASRHDAIRVIVIIVGVARGGDPSGTDHEQRADEQRGETGLAHGSSAD